MVIPEIDVGRLDVPDHSAGGVGGTVMKFRPPDFSSLFVGAEPRR
jgi:hypothetical protein